MAVSSAFTFSYEVEVSPGSGGAIETTARSLQEAAGDLAGLVGARPLVTFDANTLCFAARERPSKLGRALELVAFPVPPLRNWLIDRRLRCASVSRIELSVPGLRAVLRAGQVIRATLELDGSGIPVAPPRATLVLLSEGRVVRTWESASVVIVRS